MIFYPGMADLPADVVQALSNMEEGKRNMFLLEFERQKKTLAMGVLFTLVFGAQFGYLGKWGLQIAFWITCFWFGIGYFVELFLLQGRIKSRNAEIARSLIVLFM